jgi:hypothetical protein
MSRLPFWFIVTGMIGFALFQAASLVTLFGWIGDGVRGPAGWFNVHLFVLGWATMLAMGAVYQLIGVILQSKLYSERLGYVHYAVFTVGLTGLLSGFVRGEIEWIAASASLTFIGILLFAWNVAATLIRASQWNTITASAATAVLYLVLTGLAGMVMGLNFATGWWNDLHNRLFGAHIWFGTVGWFGLLITGFSYKMLPMFYLAHHYPTMLQKAVLWIWNAATLIGAGSFLAGGSDWLILSALILLAVAVVLYNIHLLQIRRDRHKRSPGKGIQWSMYGNHALAVIVAAAAVWAMANPQRMLDTKAVLLAGWIWLAGWVSFMILCYASKIIPFLWWTRKYGHRAGQPGTPILADLLDERKVNVSLAVIAGSLLLPAAGLLLDSQALVAAGGAVNAVGSLFYVALLGLVFSR